MKHNTTPIHNHRIINIINPAGNRHNSSKIMEPRILAGHKYLCKKSVQMYVIRDNGTRKATGMEAYTKGKVYAGAADYGYPGDKHTCGFITDNMNHAHAWPYDPQNHLWCHENWTEHFEDITK